MEIILGIFTFGVIVYGLSTKKPSHKIISMIMAVVFIIGLMFLVYNTDSYNKMALEIHYKLMDSVYVPIDTIYIESDTCKFESYHIYD